MANDSKKKVTLKDIAAKTGLSVNTVSRVLNKKPYYTKEVEEKVNAACKELGYIVDMNASGLRSGSTHTIAILFDDLVNPFYSYTTDIISRRFEEKGYNSIIFANNGRTAYVDYEQMRNVMARKPDGILSFLEPEPDMVEFIRNSNTVRHFRKRRQALRHDGGGRGRSIRRQTRRMAYRGLRVYEARVCRQLARRKSLPRQAARL